jgi:hypothetical protein
MFHYTAKFIGYINERKRPENFPRSIYCIGTYQVNNVAELAALINNEMETIFRIQGMMIQIDPTTIDPAKINVEGRIFVPMHMITHIRAEIKQMQPRPLVVDTGVLDAAGKPVAAYENAEGQRILPS